jgi:hypothetical protein
VTAAPFNIPLNSWKILSNEDRSQFTKLDAEFNWRAETAKKHKASTHQGEGKAFRAELERVFQFVQYGTGPRTLDA